MARMDETNLRILQLLQKNARISLTDLAQAVGRSETTVRERVTALELGGFLRGYEARIDLEQAGLPALAILYARCDLTRSAAVAKQLAAIPNVTRALLITGPKPVLVMMRVRDLNHLQTILKERLSEDLTDIEVQITLESLVERRPPALVETPPVPNATVAPARATA
ncbi:MAG: Lrp/AsnC family transcriptional regulator [bacterium]